MYNECQGASTRQQTKGLNNIRSINDLITMFIRACAPSLVTVYFLVMVATPFNKRKVKLGGVIPCGYNFPQKMSGIFSMWT